MADALASKMFRELRKRSKAGRVHVDMFLVADVLVVEFIDTNPLLVVRRPQQIDEVPLELVAVVVDVLLGVLTDDLEVACMRF
jgi:hypothetical protein